MQEVTPHQSINYQQLQNLPSNNVADALKYMAGVQIKDYGGFPWCPRIPYDIQTDSCPCYE